MASALEQFIRFGTDAAGLERFFRLIQAILQVTVSYEAPFGILVGAVRFWQTPPPAAVGVSSTGITTILRGLHSRVAVGRRLFRLFRFVESFHAAHRLWRGPGGSSRSSATSSGRRLVETYLGVLGRTFNGMYLLLEASLVLDALDVEGLRPWGSRGPAMGVEAQRFWFLSLVCGALVGAMQLLELWAHAPVPETANGYGGPKWKQEEEEQKAEGGATGKEEKRRVASMSPQQRQREPESKEQRLIQQRSRMGRSRKIGRRLVADVLDLAIPGSIVGYIDAGEGPVGLAMLTSTILTGLEVWERCGQEVDAMSG